MQPRSHRPDVAHILDDLRRIVRVLRESSRAAERALGVSGAQLFALKAIDERPGASVGEVAERTRTHQSTVSVVVKRLLDAKLVSRATSTTDARRIELEVTAKGRALLARAPLAAQERLIDGVEQLSRKDADELASTLRRLVAAMNVDDEQPVMFFEEETSAAPRRSARPSRTTRTTRRTRTEARRGA